MVEVNNLDWASSQLSNLLVEKAVEDWGAASTHNIWGTYNCDALGASAGPLPNATIVMPWEAGARGCPNTGTTENPDVGHQ